MRMRLLCAAVLVVAGCRRQQPASTSDRTRELIAHFKAVCGRDSLGKQGGSTDEILKRVNDCSAAEKALAQQGAAPVPMLAALLSDADGYITSTAADTLRQIGAPAAAAVPQLLKAIERVDKYGRFTEYNALGALVTVAPYSPLVVPGLAKVATRQGGDRWRFFDALGQIGPPAESALPLLLAAVKSTDVDEEERGFAAEAIEQIAGKKGPQFTRAVLLPLDPKLALAVDTYADAFESMDDLVERFEAAQALVETLEKSKWPYHATDAQFEQVSARTPGVRVERGAEHPYIYTDIQFFKKAAEQANKPENLAFFRLLDETYPESIRLFCEQGASDYGDCTKFENGMFTTMYGKWAAYSPPTATLRRLAEKVRSEILEELTSDCVCAPKADPIIEEYERFLKQFPDLPGAKQLRMRLDDLRSGALKLHYECRPG